LGTEILRILKSGVFVEYNPRKDDKIPCGAFAGDHRFNILPPNGTKAHPFTNASRLYSIEERRDIWAHFKERFHFAHDIFRIVKKFVQNLLSFLFFKKKFIINEFSFKRN